MTTSDAATAGPMGSEVRGGGEWTIHVSDRDDRFAMILDDEADLVADLVLEHVAERLVADRAEVERLRGIVAAVEKLCEREVENKRRCGDIHASGAICGCSSKDCYEHGNWHNCTCGPLTAVRAALNGEVA